MLKVAYIFPGQGAQYVGMGKELYDTSPAARDVIDKAEAFLGNGLKSVMFEGPAEKLTLTAYCQPAILAHSLAALKALESHPKFKEIEPCAAAGLSLGEYSALAASGALSLEETLDLVKKRSNYMEDATKQQKGKMSAVIGLEKEKILEICSKTGAEVANFNSPQQIVITGHAEGVEEAGKLIEEAGAKKIIPLDVSGAFHSSLMKPAADRFAPELHNVTIKKPSFAVLSNVDAVPETNPDKISRNLAKQITSSVQWVDTIVNMAAQGVNIFLEIGPGDVLKGLVKRIDRKLTVHTIATPEDIENLPL